MQIAAPNLSSLPYAISAADLDSYRENGWIRLESVCPYDEVQEWGDVIRDAAMKHNVETRPLEERDTYGKAFLQIMNLWQKDERVAQFTLAKRFAGIAAQLLGCEKVRLYHDQALFKEPGGGHTPWHQDGYFWPLRQDRTVTMWMPLINVSAEMGTMSFADTSHSLGVIPLTSGISDQSEAFYEGYIQGKGYKVRTSGAMKAGDATFHSGLTLHRAPGNPTTQVRAVMTVIYVADGEAVQAPTNPNQEVDLAQWLPGLKAGDPVASPLNPLL